MSWNPNPTGRGGFRDHPEHMIAVRGAEAIRRGTTGGRKSGTIRHNTAKWKAVDAAVKASQGGALSWELLADFYDRTWRAGYSAQWNAKRRAKTPSEAA
jgi:hypothetical protein